MTYARCLASAEWRGLVALFACAVVVPLANGLIDLSLSSWSIHTTDEYLSRASIGTVVLGFIPTVLYGAPLYALLAHRRAATLGRAILIGIIPGVAALAFLLSPRNQWHVPLSLGAMAIVCGALISAAVHTSMAKSEKVESGL